MDADSSKQAMAQDKQDESGDGHLERWFDLATKYMPVLVIALGALFLVYPVVVLVVGQVARNGTVVMAQFGDAMAFPATLAGGVALLVSASALLVQRADMKAQLNEFRRSSEAQTEMADRQRALIEAQLESAAAMRELAVISERDTAQSRLHSLHDRMQKLNSVLGSFTNNVHDLKEQLLKAQPGEELIDRVVGLKESVGTAYHNIRIKQLSEATDAISNLNARLANETSEERDQRLKQTRAWLDQMTERTAELETFRREFEAIRAEAGIT